MVIYDKSNLPYKNITSFSHDCKEQVSEQFLSQQHMQIILIIWYGDKQKENNCSCRTLACIVHIYTGGQRVISGLVIDVMKKILRWKSCP